jgi:hypothetical protein
MTIAELAGHLRAAEDGERRRLFLEFLEEYRWEPSPDRVALVEPEPPSTGDERWDVLLAAVAEHLATQDDVDAPAWTEGRSLQTWWFPDDTAYGRTDAFVRAPAAFRRRGVFIAEHDLARA